MTIPATPIKEAALRYSPEMADAFQKALTERPATKKSLAVCEIRAAQTPIPIVTSTIRATKSTGIQAALATIRPLPLAGQRRRLALHGLRGPHEVGRQPPGDRVEQHAQEQPGSAEAGHARVCQPGPVLVDQR